MVWLKSTPIPQPLDDAPVSTLGDASETAGEATLRALLGWLDERALAPGTRLPAERQLAAELGVGRPALREALRALAALGRVESRRGAGHYLRASAPSIRTPARTEVSTETENRSPAADATQVREARMVLECGAASLAAVRGDLSFVIEAAREYEEPGTDAVREAVLDMAFHLAVVRAAANPVLLALAQTLVSWHTPATEPPTGEQRIERWEAHRQIVDALTARDASRAASAMRRHWKALASEEQA